MKFFHAQVNDRRKKLQLKGIQDINRDWIEDHEEMAAEAVNFFQAQFHEDKIPTSFEIIDHVPKMVTSEQNLELLKQPTFDEVKRAVFGLNCDSAGGPDGFT